MPNEVNTYPIQQFIESVKLADMTQQKTITLDIKTARTLAFNLGELTAKLAQDYETLISKMQSADNQIIELRMDGGGFK